MRPSVLSDTVPRMGTGSVGERMTGAGAGEEDRRPLVPVGPGPGRPDPGLYGPSSEAWSLNREAMLLLGAGPRALLLQLAPPQVAAGVADHSDFRADPWARLDGTLRSYLRIVYGTRTAATA